MKAIIVENVGKEFTLGLTGVKSLREAFGGLNLSKRKGTADKFWALRGVTFSVNEGEVLGVIGRNGAGKSTLLKILSKITPPTTGRIELRGNLASLLEVGTGFHPELTGKENIFLNGSILGMRRREIKQKLDEIIDFSGIHGFLDTPVKRYSSGMYVRLAFAVAAHLEPEILVIDEVLAVGDAEFQAKCLGKMNQVAKSGRTVIFVSHNMAAVKQLCTSAILLENGKISSRGRVDSVIGDYLHQSSSQSKSYTGQLVKSIKVGQVETHLELEVNYDLGQERFKPVLGFVVHRTDGEPLFTHSMYISPNSSEYKSRIYPKRGRIRAIITEPKLMDGRYNVSVFFGDGHQDFFIDRNGISFEIAGMTSNKQRPPHKVGYIAPECTYNIMKQ